MRHYFLNVRNWVVTPFVALACIVALAEPPHIAIGLTTPLSGPDAAFGQGLRQGAQLAIERVNVSGGINGRQLELIALDDSGDPTRAANNARELLQRGVVALTGVYGARSTAAVAAVLSREGQELAVAPLIGPATSADVLRDPVRRGVFHLRAGTGEQISAVILHLDTVGMTRFSVVAQDDQLGDSGLDSLLMELMRMAMKPLSSARVRASDGAAGVRRAMKSVCAAEPQAVLLALDGPLAAAAMEAGRAEHCGAQYVVFSETGATLLATSRTPATGPNPLSGLLVAQVMPSPTNLSHPLVAEYQRALVTQGEGVKATQASYSSIEGYQAMRVLIEALRLCHRDPSGNCMQQMLLSHSIELPGLRVQFGAAQRQPRPFVEMTLIDAWGHLHR